MAKLICPRCGSGSFRYVKSKNGSYCLKCGYELTQEDIDKQLSD